MTANARLTLAEIDALCTFVANYEHASIWDGAGDIDAATGHFVVVDLSDAGDHREAREITGTDLPRGVFLLVTTPVGTMVESHADADAAEIAYSERLAAYDAETYPLSEERYGDTRVDYQQAVRHAYSVIASGGRDALGVRTALVRLADARAEFRSCLSDWLTQVGFDVDSIEVGLRDARREAIGFEVLARGEARAARLDSIERMRSHRVAVGDVLVVSASYAGDVLGVDTSDPAVALVVVGTTRALAHGRETLDRISLTPASVALRSSLSGEIVLGDDTLDRFVDALGYTLR